MVGIGNLSKGTLTGRETHVYYDSISGAYSDPPTETEVWIELARIRNVQFDDGPELNDVNYHGTATNGATPGYDGHKGSLEYVRRRGTDPVYDYLKAQQKAADPVYLQFLDDEIAVVGAKGHAAPYYLGQFGETRNGSDEVVITMPFSFADVYDYAGVQVPKIDVTIV